MKGRIVIAVFALMTGIIAVIGIVSYVGGVRQQVANEAKSVKVVVADKEITAGTTFDDLIKNDMISVKSIPKRYVTAGAIGSTSELRDRITKVDVGKGEQLTLNKLESSLKTAELTVRIKGNMRAIAIPYDEVKGVSGVIKSGDRVDVVATFDKEVAGDNITQTILRNIEVLNVAGAVPEAFSNEKKNGGVLASSSSSSQATVKKTLILAVPAADIEKLVFAEKKGTVWLALVPSKSADVPTGGQNVHTVLGR